MDGHILVLLNEGTNAAPVFNGATRLQVDGIDFDIGTRAAPRVFDWNYDGLKDILVGEYEGYVYFLQNVGTNAAPVFDTAENFFCVTVRPYAIRTIRATPRVQGSSQSIGTTSVSMT